MIYSLSHSQWLMFFTILTLVVSWVSSVFEIKQAERSAAKSWYRETLKMPASKRADAWYELALAIKFEASLFRTMFVAIYVLAALIVLFFKTEVVFTTFGVVSIICALRAWMHRDGNLPMHMVVMKYRRALNGSNELIAPRQAHPFENNAA